MRFSLVLAHPEPAAGEIPEEAIAQMQDAFGAYGRALEESGVLIAAEVLAPTSSATTITLRNGSLEVQDGPFAETKDALAGIFVIDVPDLDAALGWAEKCPAAQYGLIEVRAAATSFVDGTWNDGCRLT
ncbi:YciI family protein [Knoellia sp. S7-12]|uniref:YciI family protein n=1 Tax=Knoellia sp. S7-12 TaxID=3126698 RepID=UPI003367FF5B